MKKISFGNDPNAKLNILCLGAHCDDIEIGCGGTLIRLLDEYKHTAVKWVVFTSDEKREKEALKSAGLLLHGLQEQDIDILGYKDGFLPSVWGDVKGEFEHIRKQFQPDVIFTHYRFDLHQDHRILNELTWNTFRNHFILEYEIPKYDGDLGTPNFFVHLSPNVVKTKLRILQECYHSQLGKHWFDDELLTSIMRLRGMEAVSESGYAEAFYSRKTIM